MSACLCSTYMGLLELPPCALVHHSLFTLWSKAKVSDQVYLVEELSHQVVLVIHFLSQLVNSKTKVYLTS
ncbi:unnamed protein product [Prunus armeniaca]